MRPWVSRRDAERTSFLLLIKGVSSVGGETGIFKVRAGGWGGFQFDEPARNPKKVTLELRHARRPISSPGKRQFLTKIQSRPKKRGRGKFLPYN
jgi:hypothetical protein